MEHQNATTCSVASAATITQHAPGAYQNTRGSCTWPVRSAASSPRPRRRGPSGTRCQVYPPSADAASAWCSSPVCGSVAV